MELWVKEVAREGESVCECERESKVRRDQRLRLFVDENNQATDDNSFNFHRVNKIEPVPQKGPLIKPTQI